MRNHDNPDDSYTDKPKRNTRNSNNDNDKPSKPKQRNDSRNKLDQDHPDDPNDSENLKLLILEILNLITNLKPGEAILISSSSIEIDSGASKYKRPRSLSQSEDPSAKKLKPDDHDSFQEKLNNKRCELDAFIQNNNQVIQGGVPAKTTLKDRLIVSHIPLQSKAQILQKYNETKKNGSEYEKFAPWLQSLLQIPFGVVKQMPVNLDSGNEAISNFLQKSKNAMDLAVTGHENAKQEILDFIARLIANPRGRGNVIALCGEKGIGKTRLIKKGVSEALGLPMHTINFGGLNDVHHLIGFDQTYVSSKYGRIAQILIESACENPIIYLDELDKVTDNGQNRSSKSSDIYGVLMHLLDDEQAHHFEDAYFMGIKLDLSKAIFIASFNDMDAIDPILLDRIKVIHVSPPTESQKLEIVQKHLLPELCLQINRPPSHFVLNDDLINYILLKTPKEPGCRKLKQTLQSLLLRMNTKILTSTQPVSEQSPCVFDKAFVDSCLPNTRPSDLTYQSMYL